MILYDYSDLVGRDERGGRVGDHAVLRLPLLWKWERVWIEWKWKFWDKTNPHIRRIRRFSKRRNGWNPSGHLVYSSTWNVSSFIIKRRPVYSDVICVRTKSGHEIQVFRIFKLARVLKLARHSPGLQVISKSLYFQKLEYIFGSWCRLLVQAIVYTLRSSYKELGLLIFLVSISGFIFARWICQIFSSGIQFRVQKS